MKKLKLKLEEMVRRWIGPNQGKLYVIVITMEVGNYRRTVVGNYERCIKLTTRIIRELVESGYLRDGIRIEVYPNEKAYAYLAINNKTDSDPDLQRKAG